jgi:hypothetical protein
MMSSFIPRNTPTTNTAAYAHSGRFQLASRSLPGDLFTFRKPATTDNKDLQYISDEAWAEALAKAQSTDRKVKKSGRQTLVRYNHAGRIRETNEGAMILQAC